MGALVLFSLFIATSAPSPGPQARSAVELDRAGWEAIHANRLQDAADAFREALRLDGRNIRLMLGAGLAAHLLGRSEEARQHLSAVLQINPSLTEASILLGQILHRSGDLEGAIHAYEQALAHVPRHVELTARLEVWRREREIHDRFSQRYGDHFTVLFEGPQEEALAQRLIARLEAAYWRIGTALGAYPNGIITVVLYTNEQFRDVTRSPDWAAAAFDGRIRIPMRGALDNPHELDRLLGHEFTHALVYSLAPRGVPQWLNEGLAQFFEGAPAPAAGVDLSRGAPFRLAELEEPFGGFDRDRARHAYVQSALAAQALIDRIGMTGVSNLLAFLGEGMPFAQAFERAAFMTYDEFGRTWTAREP